jgi:shikimate kinase
LVVIENNSLSLPDVRHKLGNIILTGASGSGKSAIGQQIAKLLGLGFIDLDELIEKASGKKIEEIFASDGELVFREYEAKLLSGLQNLRSHVIAVGGGALLSNDAMATAQKIGPVVWIQSSAGEISRRLFRRISEIEKRPLFRDLVSEENHEMRREKIRERVQKMIDERRPWYSQADVVLDGSYVTPEMAAQHLKDILVSEGIMKTDRNRFSSSQKKGSL